MGGRQKSRRSPDIVHTLCRPKVISWFARSTNRSSSSATLQPSSSRSLLEQEDVAAERPGVSSRTNSRSIVEQEDIAVERCWGSSRANSRSLQEQEVVAAERREGSSKADSIRVTKKHEHEVELEEKVKNFLVKTPQQLVTNMEDLMLLLKSVEDYLEERSRSVESISSSNQVEQTHAQDVRSLKKPTSGKLLEQSADLFGGLFTKVGDAFKKTGEYASTLGDPKNDIVRTVANTFSHMGQLQWVGLLLSGIAFALRNWETFTTNKELLIRTWKSMCQLGRAVVLASKIESDNPGVMELLGKIIQRAVECIFNCLQQSISKISEGAVRRFICGNLNQELLINHESQINDMCNMLATAFGLTLIDMGLTQRDAIQELDKKLTVLMNEQSSAENPEDMMLPASDLEDTSRLVGIDTPLLRVKEMLKISDAEKQETKIHAVVIHGMVGIGKSTLGKRLYHDLISGGEIDEDMACTLDMSPPNTVEMLQDELLLKFGCQERKPASRNVVKQKLVQCFKRLTRCVFIFIDNVEEGWSLEQLLPYPIISCLQVGVRILVATRNADVKKGVEAIGKLKSDQVELFEMKELDEDSSKILLRHHMLKDSETQLPVTLIQYEERVLKACEGLPLALEVIGSYLHEQECDEDVWKWVIEALEKPFAPDGSAIGDQLTKALEFSYSNLNLECKQALIDIAFCYNQSPWSDVKILYRHSLEVLRKRALLKKEVKTFKDSGLQLECVKVHSCFVAWCRKKAEDLGSHIRIDGSSASWKFDKVPQVLVVQGGCRGGYQTVPATNLDNIIGRLRILIMTDVKFGGICMQVPRELECLYCHHSNVPFSMVDLKNLTLVDISSSVDKEYKIPRGVRKLRLDAPSLEMLQFAPESELQELGLMFCPRLQIHREHNSFPRLRKLVIRNGSHLESIPTQLTSLQSLSVQSCTSLHVPEDLNRLENLELLHISGADFDKLPENLFRLKKLTCLTLEDCPLLEKLPKEMDCSSQLEFLGVKGCSKLDLYPDSFQALLQQPDRARSVGDHSRREGSSELSRWLKGPGSAEKLQQKATAAKYMIPLIHTRGTFDRLSDLVYELHTEEDPNVEIVFLPGIFREAIDNREAHWRTWRRKGTEECWLQTLLAEELNGLEIKPRILSVSYESLLNNSAEPEDFLTETMIRDLILHPDSCVGQRSVPVILVGHGLGGIVIKHLMRTVLKKTQGVEGEKGIRDKLRNFCTNLNALVFYATPLDGSVAMEKLAASIQEDTPNKMLRFLKVLSKEMAILNEYIRQERQKGTLKFQIFALGEGNETNQGDFQHVVVVHEASARRDTDAFVTVMEDHYGVAQPKDKYSRSIGFLVDKVYEVVSSTV